MHALASATLVCRAQSILCQRATYWFHPPEAHLARNAQFWCCKLSCSTYWSSCKQRNAGVNLSSSLAAPGGGSNHRDSGNVPSSSAARPPGSKMPRRAIRLPWPLRWNLPRTSSLVVTINVPFGALRASAQARSLLS